MNQTCRWVFRLWACALAATAIACTGGLDAETDLVEVNLAILSEVEACEGCELELEIRQGDELALVDRWRMADLDTSEALPRARFVLAPGNYEIVATLHDVTRDNPQGIGGLLGVEVMPDVTNELIVSLAPSDRVSAPKGVASVPLSHVQTMRTFIQSVSTCGAGVEGSTCTNIVYTETGVESVRAYYAGQLISGTKISATGWRVTFPRVAGLLNVSFQAKKSGLWGNWVSKTIVVAGIKVVNPCDAGASDALCTNLVSTVGAVEQVRAFYAGQYIQGTVANSSGTIWSVSFPRVAGQSQVSFQARAYGVWGSSTPKTIVVTDPPPPPPPPMSATMECSAATCDVTVDVNFSVPVLAVWVSWSDKNEAATYLLQSDNWLYHGPATLSGHLVTITALGEGEVLLGTACLGLAGTPTECP